jgi:ABC-type spermidine/putrescine transport system permease subunit II
MRIAIITAATVALLKAKLGQRQLSEDGGGYVAMRGMTRAPIARPRIASAGSGLELAINISVVAGYLSVATCHRVVVPHHSRVQHSRSYSSPRSCATCAVDTHARLSSIGDII